MAIGPKLDLRQTQGLVMTPQLQQAIKLLQLNNLELSEFLKEELEKNPLLELQEGPDEDQSEREKEFVESQSRLEKIQELKSKSQKDQSDDHIDKAPLDADYENIWTSDQFSGASKGGSRDFSDDEFSYEKTLSSEKSLRDHLQEQLFLTFDEDEEEARAIGFALIDRLSPAGYLREAVDEIAFALGVEEEVVEKVLEQLKKFDPTGIFAHDLQECLALQLAEKNRLDPAMQALLDNLGMLGQHDHKGLMKACGVDLEDLKDMLGELRALNPKPAGLFDDLIVQTAIPDVIMRPQSREAGGGWMVELNSATLPRALVNKHYYEEITEIAHNKREKEFVDEQFANANWIVRAMDQRAQTILKVASEIIRQQDSFFAYGLQYLKPMTLKDIAEKIEMHESTVSRVTAGKYIGTPRGLFELKFFFTSGVSGHDGGMEHSSEAIKARIKALIDDEDPKKPLSDDALASQLQTDGIDIARRTVAKYREAMNISSSSKRKREKASLL